uniref:Uncharacterized protein n=1 Tax=Arundo donax TaxID=35708 RepID=A0A0A9DMJ5_ARUDO
MPPPRRRTTPTRHLRPLPPRIHWLLLSLRRYTLYSLPSTYGLLPTLGCTRQGHREQWRRQCTGKQGRSRGGRARGGAPVPHPPRPSPLRHAKKRWRCPTLPCVHRCRGRPDLTRLSCRWQNPAGTNPSVHCRLQARRCARQVDLP